MYMRPIQIACARCRKSLGLARNDRRLTFDERAHDLCPECWQALDEWLSANGRVRGTNEAAA